MKSILKSILSAGDDTLSSKRACGILGFISVICIGVYCTINKVQAPLITDSILLASTALLGVDSVTGIFKK